MQTEKTVEKVAILADPRDPHTAKTIAKAARELCGHLERIGVASETFIGVDRNKIKPSENVSLFLVLGGDGTMIHFAAKLSEYGLPFYGLNYGNVGFMMNNPNEGLDTHAARIRSANYMFWEFPILGVKARDLEGRSHEGYGLNDIYLQRMTPQSCKVEIELHHHPLDINPVLCDGLVVSTPLGSTAYNYNISGSMVAINASVITLTPVAAQRACPVSCMMLPMDTKIQFEILEPLKRRVQVVCDGQSYGDLTQAEISVSGRVVRLCFDPEYSRNLPMRFINKACK